MKIFYYSLSKTVRNEKTKRFVFSFVVERIILTNLTWWHCGKLKICGSPQSWTLMTIFRTRLLWLIKWCRIFHCQIFLWEMRFGELLCNHFILNSDYEIVLSETIFNPRFMCETRLYLWLFFNQHELTKKCAVCRALVF